MKTPHLFLVPCSLFLALAALAAPAPDLAALEKAAEDARLFAETNVVEEVEAPLETDVEK